MHVFTFLFLIMCGIHKDMAEDLNCKTNESCDCCNSNPNDGSRELGDICYNQIRGWQCVYGCKDGYWDQRCWGICPSYCTRCARYFGFSLHKHYQICYLCADGYYNGTGITNCSTPCPPNCAENQCDKTTGKCLQGCTSNNWRGDKCNVCADTWYGNNCDIECPSICKDKLCDGNGDCITGCANENFTGSHCDHCKAWKYGDNCDMNCPVNCQSHLCTRNGGDCTNGCKGNFVGNKCNECAYGMFGDACDNTCSIGCKNSVCDRNTAICSQDCEIGYSGDKCCVNTNGCEVCDTTSTCSKCTTGYYGDFCGQTCPENCTGACDKNTGTCESCKDGRYYGAKCGTQCPDRCLDGKCRQDSGRCENAMQVTTCSCPIGGAVGGTIAVFTVITILSHVLCYMWRRRQSTESSRELTMPEVSINKEGTNVKAVYENMKITAEGL